MPRMRIGIPKGVIEKKPKPSSPWRTSSLLTTRFGAVATSVIMPLMSAAKLRGIMSWPGELPVVNATRSATGMKIAVTAVELMSEPRPQTQSIRRTRSLVSLFPVLAMSMSPSFLATPVLTSPSPMTKSAAMRMMLESLKPASDSLMEITPVNGRATSMMSATASMRGLLSPNMTIAEIRRPRTSASSVFMV